MAVKQRHKLYRQHLPLARSKFFLYPLGMESVDNTAVIAALKSVIETKKQELADLEAHVAKLQREMASGGKQQRLRFRKQTGFKPGSIPDMVNKILTEAGQAKSAAELAEALSAKGKNVESKMIAASIARYIDKVFRRNIEGKYELMT